MGGTPPCSHGGSIEVWASGSNDVASETLRRVHTAAPLKSAACLWPSRSAGDTPPCSHGGSIEVRDRVGEQHHLRPLRRVHTAAPLKFELREADRLRKLSLRRVHTAAPLKCDACSQQRGHVCALRRVHTAAPLKSWLRGDTPSRACGTPPCSHGGSIEVAPTYCVCIVGFSTPPCSHGGSIEVVNPADGAEIDVQHSAVFTRRLH